MVTPVKYNCAVDVIDSSLATDTWKAALTNTAPNVATHTVLADITDLTTSGGYTAGGNSCTVTSWTNSSGTKKLILADPTMWTASGGGFTFRYVVLYNVTQNKLFQYADYGSAVVMSGANTDTFTADLDQTNGIFTVT
jgi:hypothetical protein